MIKCDNAHCGKKFLTADAYFVKIYHAMLDMDDLNFSSYRINLCPYCRDLLGKVIQELLEDMQKGEKVI